MPYRGKRFWNHQIPTSIVAEKNVTKNILEGRTDGQTEVKQYSPPPSRSGGIIRSKIGSKCVDLILIRLATIDGRNLIFGHKLHICMPYRGKRFWNHQIPTSCLPT
jgi:hypothetical protein